MKLIPISLLAAASIFTSCTNLDQGEAQARHAEMKQIISSYDQKVSTQQAEMETKLKQQEKTIAELKNIVEATQKDLKEWTSAKNADYVQAALSLKSIPNHTISRSVITILGQLKGPAAEQGIVDIILSDNDSSYTSTGLDILKSIGSKKLRDVCLQIIEKGNPKTMQYAFRYISPVANEEDVKAIIEIAKNLSTSSKDYNIRYCWEQLLKLLLDRGGKDCVPVVLKAIDNFNKESFTSICWGAIIATRYGSAEQVKSAINILKPYLSNKNVRMNSDIPYYFRDSSKVEYIPIMNLLIEKASSSYKRYFIEGFTNLSHPIIAARLVEEYQTNKDSSTKSILTKSFQNGYPGIMWFEDKKEAKLIPEKELKELINKFAK